MAYSGKYVVQNKERYRGKVNDVQYRSLWELQVMKHLDVNPHVKWWSSEETIVPYFSTADQKNRRYFMDFTVCYNDGTMHLWEVKPAKQTQPPKPPSRMTTQAKKRFADEIYTWQVNLDKWKSTKKLVDSKGWTFKILTEHTLKTHFGLKC